MVQAGSAGGATAFMAYAALIGVAIGFSLRWAVYEALKLRKDRGGAPGAAAKAPAAPWPRWRKAK